MLVIKIKLKSIKNLIGRDVWVIRNMKRKTHLNLLRERKKLEKYLLVAFY